MQPTNQPALWRITLGALVIWIAGTGSLKADLYQSCIRTVEWLVDNSDVIAVTRKSPDAEGDEPTVLRTLKGDAARIKRPLERPRLEGCTYYEPPTDGPVRLIFVRGRSELLGSVKLGRERLEGTKVYDILYGVTQYGSLLVTQSDLFDAIDVRLRSGPGRAIARKEDSPHFKRSGIEAPRSFPLEDSDDTYVLIVPFTVARRDHYIEELKSGDAEERLHAIYELYQLVDTKALSAIRDATTCRNVEPTYDFTWSSRTVRVLRTQHVRKAARIAMDTKGHLSRFVLFSFEVPR